MFSRSDNTLLSETDACVTAENNVIQHGDPQGLARLFQSLGHGVIFLARCRVSGRMIVDENNRSGRVLDGRPKDLARVDEAGVQCAHGYLVSGDNLVLGIEADNMKIPPGPRRRRVAKSVADKIELLDRCQ